MMSFATKRPRTLCRTTPLHFAPQSTVRRARKKVGHSVRYRSSRRERRNELQCDCWESGDARRNKLCNVPVPRPVTSGVPRSIPRRQAGVDDDVFLFHVDVAAGGKILEDARYHFARSADAVGDVLLSELVLDHQAVALRRRHAEQGLGDAAVDVEQREALHFVGERAHAVSEIFDETDGDDGIVREEIAEYVLRQYAETAALQRHHRSRTRGIVEKREFAEIFAGPLMIDYDFLALLVGEVDLHSAVLNKIKRIAAIALVDDHRVLGVVAHPGVTAELRELH